jgi:2-hydroxychromene-2-carboxylate isomerase
MLKNRLVVSLQTVVHYFDYKSPYAYLAQEGTFNIAKRDDVKMVWVPYGLKIGKYLGEAALDDAGEDMIKTRNDHQWRRVRYSYMDCRREANKKGLTLLGPKKIFDSSLSHMAFLFLLKNANPERFHRSIFKQFWERKLNIESYEEITKLMLELGYKTEGFESYVKSEGKKKYLKIQAEAEREGIFGVPSWRINGELFWGAEHLDSINEILDTIELSRKRGT